MKGPNDGIVTVIFFWIASSNAVNIYSEYLVEFLKLLWFCNCILSRRRTVEKASEYVKQLSEKDSKGYDVNVSNFSSEVEQVPSNG